MTFYLITSINKIDSLFKFRLTERVIIAMTTYQGAVKQIRKSAGRSFKLREYEKKRGRELPSIEDRNDECGGGGGRVGVGGVNGPNEDLL